MHAGSDKLSLTSRVSGQIDRHRDTHKKRERFINILNQRNGSIFIKKNFLLIIKSDETKEKKL